VIGPLPSCSLPLSLATASQSNTFSLPYGLSFVHEILDTLGPFGGLVRSKASWGVVFRDRTEQTLTDFFTMFGTAPSAALRYVAFDMWKPYLRVINRFANTAVHVLERFHIVAKLNKAIDEVRAGEARKLAAQGYTILKNTRWCFLKKLKNLTSSQKLKLNDVMRFD